MDLKKNILVAGGAGFIGSNLCDYLIKQGHRVFCLDCLFTGKLDNINHLMVFDDFMFIHHDIINPINIDYRIDEIYNLACPASPPKYQADPIFTLQTCFIGTMNLLNLAVKKKSKILLSSTSEIYGEPLVYPQTENYRGNVNTIGVRSCYDEGKRVAETLMMDYHKLHGTNIRIARIFNTFGPNMDKHDGRVVTNIIRQLLNNEDITIYGQGYQTRSFCYIDDMIQGLTLLMSVDFHKPVNLGNPNEITIIKLYEILSQLIESNSKITHCDLPSDDPTNRKPDINLAKNILQWEPKVSLTDGLVKTINFIKNK